MHGARQLSWKSALLTGWVVGLTASAIAQPPAAPADKPAQTAFLLARLGPRSVGPTAPELLGSRLAELEQWLARAYFSEVAEAAGELRASASLAASPPEERARFEVIAGTAHLALGAVSSAVACFKRAMEVRPELELQPRTTSPKVLRAFAAARHQLRSARLREARARSDLPARLSVAAPLSAPVSSGALRPTILCRLLIDARGSVVSASVQRPRPDLARFEEAALAAVRGYRFEPAQRDGQPVSSWLNWPVQF